VQSLIDEQNALNNYNAAGEKATEHAKIMSQNAGETKTSFDLLGDGLSQTVTGITSMSTAVSTVTGLMSVFGDETLTIGEKLT